MTDAEFELFLIKDELAEAFLLLTDDEIKEEMAADPAAAEKAIKDLDALFQQQIKEQRKEIRRSLSSSGQGQPRSRFALPARPRQRAVLNRLFLRSPDLRLTLQHRELTELSDSDVENILLNLAEMGIDITDGEEGQA